MTVGSGSSHGTGRLRRRLAGAQRHRRHDRRRVRRGPVMLCEGRIDRVRTEPEQGLALHLLGRRRRDVDRELFDHVGQHRRLDATAPDASPALALQPRRAGPAPRAEHRQRRHAVRAAHARRAGGSTTSVSIGMSVSAARLRRIRASACSSSSRAVGISRSPPGCACATRSRVRDRSGSARAPPRRRRRRCRRSRRDARSARRSTAASAVRLISTDAAPG